VVERQCRKPIIQLSARQTNRSQKIHSNHKESDQSTEISFDAFPPPGMATKAEGVESKIWAGLFDHVHAGDPGWTFIGVGAIFATTVLASTSYHRTAARLLGGLVFSTGLILVVVGGAELFTGNNLIIMAFATARRSRWLPAAQLGHCVCGQLSARFSPPTSCS
jgi:hypothetical protein